MREVEARLRRTRKAAGTVVRTPRVSRATPILGRRRRDNFGDARSPTPAPRAARVRITKRNSGKESSIFFMDTSLDGGAAISPPPASLLWRGLRAQRRGGLSSGLGKRAGRPGGRRMRPDGRIETRYRSVRAGRTPGAAPGRRGLGTALHRALLIGRQHGQDLTLQRLHVALHLLRVRVPGQDILPERFGIGSRGEIRLKLLAVGAKRLLVRLQARPCTGDKGLDRRLLVGGEIEVVKAAAESSERVALAAGAGGWIVGQDCGRRHGQREQACGEDPWVSVHRGITPCCLRCREPFPDVPSASGKTCGGVLEITPHREGGRKRFETRGMGTPHSVRNQSAGPAISSRSSGWFSSHRAMKGQLGTIRELPARAKAIASRTSADPSPRPRSATGTSVCIRWRTRAAARRSARSPPPGVAP